MPEATLTISDCSRTWDVPVEAKGLVIGRHPSCGLVLDVPGVSRVHAQCRCSDFARADQGQEFRNVGLAVGAKPQPLSLELKPAATAETG